MALDLDLMQKIKHAESCLIDLVGEGKFDEFVCGLPAGITDFDYMLQLNRSILELRAGAIAMNDEKARVVISQYYPHLSWIVKAAAAQKEER